MSTVHSVIQQYQEMLSLNLNFTFSSARPTLGKVGEPNRLFVIKLCSDTKLFLEFLKDSGLIKSQMTCEKCKMPMLIKERTFISDGFVWLCKRRNAGKCCGFSRSIRCGSWFSRSRLKLNEMFLLTYEIVRGTKTSDIESEYFFASNTLADWRQYIREKTSEYLESKSEKLGGAGKVVELSETKFGKRKSAKGQVIDEQCFFGGLERESGKVFLVAIQDRTPETLISLVKEWVEPGTSINSDFWKIRDSLGGDGLAYLTENHSLTFDTDGGLFKCTIPWHSRPGDFQTYLFNKHCEENKVDRFNKFLEIIAEFNCKDPNPSLQI